MKLASFSWKNKPGIGLVDEINGVLKRPQMMTSTGVGDGVTTLIGRELPDTDQDIEIADVSLCAPIPRPRRNIFCVGKNYHDHAQEFSRSGFDSSAVQGEIPQAPIIFSKVPESVIGPGQPIRIDETVSSSVDYEVELAVIIGKMGRNIRPEAALDHVWGYTIINDVTARDLQGLHSQWLIGKSQDTFCPMGPWVVLADALDLSDTKVSCFVNGELRQEANTSQLIFDVPTIIAALSNGITLMAGDVIATGTPAGVGIGFKPPKYLLTGDRVKMQIDGIGTLENPVESW